MQVVMILLLFILILIYWYTTNRDDKKAVTRYNVIITVLLVLLMGLRNECIYSDTYGYFLNFRMLENMDIAAIIARWPKDSFYYVFNHYMHPIISHNFSVWLCLIAILYMTPLSLIVKRYSVNPMWSWVCFIFLGLMMFVMAGLRQTIAMGFILIAFLKLMDGSKKYFFLFVAIAFLFHGSSFVCFLIYPLSKIRFDKTMIKWYFGAFIVMLVMGETVLTNIISYVGENDTRYIGYGESLNGSNYTYMIQQALLVLPSLYFLRNRYGERNIAIFLHLSMMAFIFVSLSPVIAEMFRLSMYFSWANMIVFPLAMNEASKRHSIAPSIYISFFTIYLVFINGTVMNKYYFWFEDATHLLQFH